MPRREVVHKVAEGALRPSVPAGSFFSAVIERCAQHNAAALIPPVIERCAQHNAATLIPLYFPAYVAPPLARCAQHDAEARPKMEEVAAELALPATYAAAFVLPPGPGSEPPRQVRGSESWPSSVAMTAAPSTSAYSSV